MNAHLRRARDALVNRAGIADDDLDIVIALERDLLQRPFVCDSMHSTITFANFDGHQPPVVLPAEGAEELAP